MGTVYYYDFRNSSGGPTGYPGEPANSVFASGSAYPSGGAVGPYTSGWGAGFGGGVDGESTYNGNIHQCGYMSSTAGVASTTFQIAGFIPGHVYNIRVSCGGVSTGPVNTGFAIYSDSSRSTTVLNVNGGSVSANQYLDASGVVRTSASDWGTNNVAASITPAVGVTSLYFCKAQGGNNAYFNTISIEDTSSSSRPLSMSLLGAG